MTEAQTKRECCQDETNLGVPTALANGLMVRVCTVCGASHYELEVEAGDLLGEGTELSG